MLLCLKLAQVRTTTWYNNYSYHVVHIVPGPVPVRSISIDLQPTSATISWREPDYIPAEYRIVTYEIGYYTSSLKRQVTLPERAILQNATSSPFVIDNLQPQTSYVFAVRPYTMIGPGEWVRVVNSTLAEPTEASGIASKQLKIMPLNRLLCLYSSNCSDWCSRWICCGSGGGLSGSATDSGLCCVSVTCTQV